LNSEVLITKLKKQFNSKCTPNGILLNWDRNRFYNELKSLLIDHDILNQTDFNYSFCNSFDIKINASENPIETYKLTLKISFILDFFTTHLTKYVNYGRVGNVVSIDSVYEAKIVCDKLKNYLSEIGYEELSVDAIDTEVPDVQLELAQKATIGKCLFDDF
jgi:hypothetical protein